MSVLRRPVTLALVLVLLGGAIGLLVVAGGSGPEESALQFPGEGQAPELVAPNPQAAVAEPGAGPRFVVDVVPRARILPPPEPGHYRVLQNGEELDVAVEALAGTGTGLLRRDRRPGRALLRLRTGERTLYRILDIEQPSARVTVEIGSGAALSGRVVDRDRRPVPEAEVWYGEADARGEWITAGCDEEGRFVLDGMIGGPGTPVVVTAPGMASQFQVVAPDGGELLFTLGPACPLQVQFVGASSEVPRARVAVVPLGAVSTDLLHYPFFLQAVNGWQPVDRQGFARFGDLPRGATVGVLLHHPRLPAKNAATVELLGEQASVPIGGDLGASLSGRVLDERQRPLPGALVASYPEGREPVAAHASRWLLPPGCLVTGMTWARADAEGRYVVGRSRSGGEGADLVVVRAAGHLGLEARIEAGRWRDGLQEDFVLAAPPDGDQDGPELRFYGPAGLSAWLRVRPEPGFVALREGEAVLRELRQPALVELRVAMEKDGRLSEPVVLPARPVVGAAEVDLLASGRARWRQ